MQGRRPCVCPDASHDEPLTPWERWLLLLLAAFVVVFGGFFELRSALLQTRKGDLNVFLRAAWAVRVGEDIYTATDDNDHHYHYPPFLAALLVPLADPPAGRAPLPGTLPYPVSVALWYVLSVALLALALHVLATALEDRLEPVDRPVPWGRRWWRLRIIPFVACLPAVGGALMRGQVDMILLALFCGMTAAALRGKSARAGFLLAAAISIKVIPAFLLLYPILKRDVRWLAGTGVGLALCLAVVPAVVFGPRQSLAYYHEWHARIVRPGLTDHGDQTRAEELTRVTATDSQSFLAMIHNTRYPTRPRPDCADRAERLAHWAIGATLTMFTLAAAFRSVWRGGQQGSSIVIILGLLMVLMVLTSPVCHLHYFSASLPLAMGLLASSWERHRNAPAVTAMLIALFAFNVIANLLPRIPGLERARDYGLASYAALALWGVGCITLWTYARLPSLTPSLDQPRQPGLAA